MTPLLPNHNRAISLLLSEASNTAGQSSIYAGIYKGGLNFYRAGIKGTVNVTFYRDIVELSIVPRSIRQWPPEKPEETPPRHQPVGRVLDKTEIEFTNLLKLLKQ